MFIQPSPVPFTHHFRHRTVFYLRWEGIVLAGEIRQDTWVVEMSNVFKWYCINSNAFKHKPVIF